jgi:AraC family transcriptional activator of pobA
MKSFPVIGVCDLFHRENKKHPFALHRVTELIEKGMLPKSPHRHSFFQILFIYSGKGIHKIDFQEYSFDQPVIFFLKPGQVHNLNLENDCKGYLINFSEDYFHTFLADHHFLDNFVFFKKIGNTINYYPEESKDEIIQLFEKLCTNFSKKNDHYKEFIRIYLIELFLVIQSRIDYPENQNNQSVQHHKIEQFQLLVENHFFEAHYPKYYADLLAISPNYLNAICNIHLNSTAGGYIRSRILLEAKRLLINSALSISEISFQLHFEDNSYFTKFFKQLTDLTPNEFRNQHNS